MGRIRPLAPADIPDIVALRRKSFPRSRRPVPADLAAYVEHVFFRNPWCDGAVPSLVYEDRAGRPAGFLGVVPRRALYQGAPVTIAVSTQLMVAPSERGLAGVQLLKAFLAGPQDLSFADLATDASRRMWEGLGGRVSVVQSFAWSEPLVPFAGRRLAGAVFRNAARLAGAAWRAAPVARATGRGPTVTALDPGAMAERCGEVLRDVALRPDYTRRSAGWLLAELADKRELGAPRSALLTGAKGGVVGWYVYYVNRGIGEVVQIAALERSYAAVLDHLLEDARGRGVEAVTGRVEPGLLSALRSRGTTLMREGPWALVHSRRRELLGAVLSGDAFLSRLEGEWWMSF